VTFDQVVQRSTELHAEIVLKLLQKTNRSADEIDVIGYHGQTLLHKPSAKITVQVGDGELLAKMTGITVVNDFRRRDVFSGGQGAPFAPLYHQALAIRDHKVPAAVVNCGGIANVTVITGEHINQVVGFDTGPGNGLIDRYIKQRTHGKELMDTNAKYGLNGRVNEETIKLLYEKSITSHSGDFFRSKPPKSLDIADFALIPELNILSIQDASATLEAFTADSIVHSTEFFDGVIPTYWILAGGGWHNPVIKRELEVRLKEKLGSHIEVLTADEAGWNGRALEAQIFAYLAVRSLMNLPISVPGTTLVPKPLCGGHAYLPPNGTTSTVANCLKQNPDILSGYFNKKSSSIFL
jgi:anhydro-N-acetylmuramic acid kinase